MKKGDPHWLSDWHSTYQTRECRKLSTASIKAITTADTTRLYLAKSSDQLLKRLSHKIMTVDQSMRVAHLLCLRAQLFSVWPSPWKQVGKARQILSQPMTVSYANNLHKYPADVHVDRAGSVTFHSPDGRLLNAARPYIPECRVFDAAPTLGGTDGMLRRRGGGGCGCFHWTNYFN